MVNISFSREKQDLRLMMVEERKADMDSKGSCESLTGGLKLKINLRDRQTVRKRHRSSSSASTDSSISANQEKQPKRSLDRAAIKRSRKERAAVTTDDSGFHDNDPVGTKLDDDSCDSLSRKNVSLEATAPNGSSNGSIKPEPMTKKPSMRSSVTRSEILLVDMNGSCPSPKRNGLPNGPTAAPQSTEQAQTKCAAEKLKDTAAPNTSALALTNGQSCPQSPKVEPSAANLVKRLSRDELERLVLEQMCLAIRERGVTGALERKLDAADQQLERYKRRTETLQKQVTDLETVVRRFVQQSKGRNQSLVPPVKTTRSVGLQINNSGALPLASATQTSSSSPKKTAPMTLVSTGAATKATAAAHTSGHVKILTSSAATSTTSVTNSSSPLSSTSTTANPPLARVPIPPCLTMQTPDIASYVPQQALPRYRSAPKRSDDSPGASKIATYVRCDVPVRPTPAVMRSITSMPTSRVVTVVPPPAAGTAIALRPFKAADAALINNAVARSRVIINNSSSSGLTAVSSASPTVTTVNKVTLPGIMPKVIDLTDDEQDRSNKKAAAAATAASSSPDYLVRLSGAQQTVSKPLGSIMPNGNSTSNGVPGARLVALKSTTLNGRSSANSQNGSATGKSSSTQQSSTIVKSTHPAALPATPLGPVNPNWKPTAPRPTLKISRVANGIVLSWTMQSSVPHADIASYQLFAYQEGSAPPSSSLWKRVGDVKALPLPMACTLTQFLEGHRYHFAVRAMDVHQRLGPYSEPASIVLS